MSELESNALPIEEEDSLTADLAAAWDASESEDGTESEGGEVHESYSESSDAQGKGRWGAGNVGGDASSGTQGDVRQDPNNPEGLSQVAEAGQELPLDSAPQGLSPESREAWNDVPDAVKADIVKRENDYARGIEKHRANTQRVQAMDRSLQPYSQLFAMNGGPGNTLPGLLQTASQLQMGSGPQKAQAVANIIKQFGVDIKTLDNMLVGESPPPEVQQQSAVQQQIQQAVAPYQQHMAQMQQHQQRQQQHAQQAVASEVNSFGSQHEFYNDVRSDMADLLDMAANRGRQMSMEEAYNTACAAHPSISKIMHSRQSQQSVQNKRQAASSIHGTSGGTMSGSAPDSVAAALNEAWDNAGRM
jgi:hypothetical protein